MSVPSVAVTYATAPDGASVWYSVNRADSSLPPLVLVQGRALDHHGWDSCIADFGDRTTVVIDHRGTGASSSQFAPGWSARDFARDVVSVLDAAGIERAHFYGHSMGGRVVQWIGAEYADRVISIVLGATGVGDDTGPARPTAGAAALASGDPERLAALFYPDWWIAEHPDKTADVLPSPHSPEAMRIHGEASDRRDGPSPEAIGVPTLVIHGEEDQLADPKNAEIFGTRVPDVQVELVPDARHAYWIGCPDAHATVSRFLTLRASPSAPC